MIDRSLTHEERSKKLDEATRRYVRGEIGMREFLVAQERYGTDWEAIVQHFARAKSGRKDPIDTDGRSQTS